MVFVIDADGIKDSYTPYVGLGYEIHVTVRDERGGSYYKVNTYFVWSEHSPTAGKERAIFVFAVNGAERVGGGPSSADEDDIEFNFFNPNQLNGYAHAHWTWSSEVNPSGQADVLGASTVYVGNTIELRSYPYWDTTGYFYQWGVDAQDVPNATSSVFSTHFSTQGIRAIRVIHTLADGTTDTATKSVTVTLPPLLVEIHGSSEVPPNIQSCYFYASITGGNGDYTYEWKKDNQSVGQNSPDLFIPTGTTDFALSITVYETGFSNGQASRTITVSSAAPSESCAQS